jgi:hypothetical protein
MGKQCRDAPKHVELHFYQFNSIAMKAYTACTVR